MITEAFARARPLVRVVLFLAALLPGVLYAQSEPRTIASSAGPIVVQTVVDGLDHPWGMAFLPDGRLLITERPGRLRILDRDNKLSPPLRGTPRVFAQRQGGLLDVAIDPDFEDNRLVYLSFAEPGEGGASTALGRGRLGSDGIEGFQVIFRQQPKVSGGNHFGGRIAFAPSGLVFLTMGERFKFDPAQDLGSDLGKIVRLQRDGSIPDDNPFVGKQGARAEIWSYGHRNVEGAAVQPGSGLLWIAELGPRGGDELNIPQPGKNYGWPLVSWGKHYDGRDIPDPPTHPEFVDAVRHWTPVISPSGIAFYSGNLFPSWRGSLLISGLTAEAIVRLSIDGQRVTDEERLALGARIRDVEQAPDGAILALTDEDNGALLRLSPARR